MIQPAHFSCPARAHLRNLLRGDEYARKNQILFLRRESSPTVLFRPAGHNSHCADDKDMDVELTSSNAGKEDPAMETEPNKPIERK